PAPRRRGRTTSRASSPSSRWPAARKQPRTWPDTPPRLAPEQGRPRVPGNAPEVLPEWGHPPGVPVAPPAEAWLTTKGGSDEGDRAHRGARGGPIPLCLPGGGADLARGAAVARLPVAPRRVGEGHRDPGRLALGHDPRFLVQDLGGVEGLRGIRPRQCQGPPRRRQLRVVRLVPALAQIG